ncbi:MAG: hypothetical protein ACTSRZ_04735 [Promethearchaeota archaeon]
MLVENNENNDSLESNIRKRGIIKKLKDFYWAMQPVFWTHHPTCDKYKGHTIHLFKKDLCIGCFVGIPSAIIMLIIGYIFPIFESFSTTNLIRISIILMSFYLLSIIGLTSYKPLKIVTKVIIGSGAAFFIAAIFSYEMPIFYKVFFTLLFNQAVLFFINAIRGLKMLHKCKKCEFKKNWNDCPGFREVNRKLELIGLRRSQIKTKNE